ncbi:MAG: hypothetical protein V1792_19695 [Pseudomonadota bacterium]
MTEIAKHHDLFFRKVFSPPDAAEREEVGRIRKRNRPPRHQGDRTMLT